MKKVIVDANVIIKLHELGKFESLLKVCEVYVTETIKDEARFYLQDLGNRVPRKVMIDLDGYIREGRLKVLRDPLLKEIAEISSRLEKKLPDQGIQLGETSSLIYLMESGSNYCFCTGDRAVMFVAEWRTKEELSDRDLKFNLRLIDYAVTDLYLRSIELGKKGDLEGRKKLALEDLKRYWRVKSEESGRTLIAYIDPLLIGPAPEAPLFTSLIPAMVLEIQE